MAVFLKSIIDHNLFSELIFNDEGKCTNYFDVVATLSDLDNYSRELVSNFEYFVDVQAGKPTEAYWTMLRKFLDPKFAGMLNLISSTYIRYKSGEMRKKRLVPITKLYLIKYIMFNIPYTECSLECFKMLQEGVDMNSLANFFIVYEDEYEFKYINTASPIFRELEKYMSEDSYQEFVYGLLDVELNDAVFLLEILVKLLKQYKEPNIALLRSIVEMASDHKDILRVIETNKPIPEDRYKYYEIVASCVNDSGVSNKIRDLIRPNQIKDPLLILLLVSIINNNVDIFQNCLSSGKLPFDINAKLPGNGNTLEIIAVLYRRLEILCLIISHSEYKKGILNNNKKGILDATKCVDFSRPNGSVIIDIDQLTTEINRVCTEF